MPLDIFDKRLLQELQRNGRISNRELAERLALSTAPCWRRMRTLEESGLINRYVALLDATKLGLNVVAFAHISLESHRTHLVAEFDTMIQTAPQVLECYMTSGEYDYMLKILAKDMADYERFLSEVLMQVSGVRTVNTSFMLKCRKFTTELPL